MRIFYFYRKRVTAFLMAVIVFGIILAGIFAISRFTQNQKSDNKAYEVLNMMENKEIASHKETENKSVVTGKDILAKYYEVKGTDYAILVATTTYLETDSDLAADEIDNLYIKYAIDESRQNMVKTIIDSNNVEVILSLVNYNSVLKDSCIFYKKGG
jgi:hypothetical protein